MNGSSRPRTPWTLIGIFPKSCCCSMICLETASLLGNEFSLSEADPIELKGFEEAYRPFVLGNKRSGS